MKSKQNAQASTSCQECNLAVFEGYSQVSCQAGRLEKFQDRMVHCKEGEDLGTEFYTILDACNYYTKERTLDEQVEFRKPRFGIAVMLDENTGSIEDTIQSICDSEYKYIHVVVAHEYTCFKQVKESVAVALKILKDRGIKSQAIMLNTGINKETEVFQSLVSNNWLLKLRAGQVVSKGVFTKIDTLLNDDLEKAVYIRDGECHFILTGAARARYLEHNNYDQMQQSLEIESKEQELFTQI